MQHSLIDDMKAALILIMCLLFFTHLISCKTQISPPLAGQLNQNCGFPPAPTTFVVLDKAGHSLIKSTDDELTISFTENGQTNHVAYVIRQLSDTTKYGSLGVDCEISSYSVRQGSPIKTFQLSINGQNAGTIYYDIEKVDFSKGCYKVNSFKFNGVEVKTDITLEPFMSVLQTS